MLEEAVIPTLDTDEKLPGISTVDSQEPQTTQPQTTQPETKIWKS